MAYQKKGCKGWYQTYRDHLGRVHPVEGDSPERVDPKIARITCAMNHTTRAKRPHTVTAKTFADLAEPFHAAKDGATRPGACDAFILKEYSPPAMGAPVQIRLATKTSAGSLQDARTTVFL